MVVRTFLVSMALKQAELIGVEEDKPVAEQGYYLHPDAFGLPPERGIAWARSHSDAVGGGASAGAGMTPSGSFETGSVASQGASASIPTGQ
jgi:hypothetical protein